VQTPGQAISQVASLGTTGSVALPGSTPVDTACVVFPDPTFSCTGHRGAVRQVLDLTATDPPGSGVVATGTATAGNDEVSMALTARSSGAALAQFESLLYNIVGIDRQRLRFEVAAPAVPEFIEVDVTFSVAATLTDRSSVEDAYYIAEAHASVFVLEAATLLAAPSMSGPMHAALAASASMNNQFDPADAVLMAAVETLRVRPNVEYWVAMESQTALSLVPSPAFPVRDYAGLDLELYAYADPSFALNADFAAAHPDIAAALSIERVAVVPLPAALPLLLGGLAAAGALGRRRRACRAS